MKSLSTFAAFWRGLKLPSTRRSNAIPITALGMALFFALASAAGLAQSANSTTDGWVVLPVDEYRALRRAAFPPDAEPVPPPVEATLSRIDYDLKVDGDLATGEARLTVDVIKEGWVRLALPDDSTDNEVSTACVSGRVKDSTCVD